MLAPYVNLEKNFFSAGVSNALFSVLKRYGNILLIEEVLETRDIALASYMPFNWPKSSRTHLEKLHNFFL